MYIYIYMYICTYIYICIYIYIYICMMHMRVFVCVSRWCGKHSQEHESCIGAHARATRARLSVYTCIYIYIYRERER